MKEEYIDTPFGELIHSYRDFRDGLSYEEIEQALRLHAKQWSGCISCRYSFLPVRLGTLKGNIWLYRSCQVGLKQDGCQMYGKFPERENE